MENSSISKFNKLFTPELQKIIDVLLIHNKEAVIVGGAVRDFFLQKPVSDIDFDIATNAQPDEITKWMVESGFKVKPIGGKFGTLLIIVHKKAFEVSTYRHEVYETPGRPPRVSFIEKIEDDLERRDFRFNALTYNINQQKFLDKYSGLEDIKRLRISTIGDPETRLREDGLRVIRLARFASKYNLSIDSELLKALEKVGKEAKFRNPAALRIEFFKLLTISTPKMGLRLLFDNNVFSAIFPKIPLVKADSDLKHHVYRYFDKFSQIPSRIVMIRLFSLLLVISKEGNLKQEIIKEVSDNLRLSVRSFQILERLIWSWDNFPRDGNLRRLKHWIRGTGINTSEDILIFIFLFAEISESTALSLKRGFIFKETQKIIKSFRNEK
ncbi:MAG: CCA tRNA nucleotidyltransferase [Candidatus Hodarchaeales archaeon]